MTTHPFLDDPIAFAHELYSLLAAGGDGRIVGGKVAAYTSFNEAIEALRSSLAHEQPPGVQPLLDRLDQLDELAISLAGDELSRGVELGVATEQLRRGILDGATAPRIPWK